MASSFSGTDIMKCGSPSTAEANHWYLYSDTQVQSSTWTFNVVMLELLMLRTSPCTSWMASSVQSILQRNDRVPRKLLPIPQKELHPFPPHLSQVNDIYPVSPNHCEIWHMDWRFRMATSKCWSLRAMKVQLRAGSSYREQAVTNTESRNGKED